MRISDIQGPSLTEVIAFTMIEKPEDVAIVERRAADRMAAVRGWYGWQVVDVEVIDDADELVRLTINAQPVGAGYREEAKFTFLTDRDGKRRSARLDAFLAACGVSERVDDTREIKGRFFATKNRGRGVRDFGPLTNALVG
ncbi:hypothetical protein HJB96_08775 [Rhizobium sp. NLR15a]|uniref:hypothetical protein n=1 Tax=Rhizobium sp. NLR15a TaxID=2731111 RepID=UPI001C83EE7C|nr:hypothetical protein [Rhizobium sp. NLR15a]MBX5293034.1 hypothetical protein [Rhizobium sp. NLR15a]